ncbi:HAD-IIIC family phosphatase [Marinagarivorans cellulosilyticus]|uniref:Polyketide synthase n=1 Tax=Marinagarivorans cellulosilyticus TaxID=2721545 RepID=A0AAN2BJK5_9GAMM|nr:HAD-IIIC family phosphatase [Marinagarivorans cellulosilyticus]BCD97036.1 hypothetical protein MARGE09_P1236 [Marinagarivorans cellulosilyticus]
MERMIESRKMAGKNTSQSMVDYLIRRIEVITKSSITKSDLKKNIMDLGVDSIGLVNIVDDIKKEFDIDLQPTIFFEYQSISELSTYLIDEVGSADAPAAAANVKETYSYIEQPDKKFESQELQSRRGHAASFVRDASEGDLEDLFNAFQGAEGGSNYQDASKSYAKPKVKAELEDIAVIGMAGKFSGSDNVNEFWENISSQKDLFSKVPSDRFDYAQWASENYDLADKIYCDRGSFISDVDKFDASFFNIPPKEAAILDPQLRLLLQVIYESIEDAGYANKIRGTNTGMYVGACFHDYELELVRNMGEMSPYFGTGNALTMLANRPSFYLDLKGPSLPLDTACSASLVAVNAALQALRNDECEMAFVAGTNLLLSPLHYRYFCAIGALSKSGNSFPFDSRADGYLPGEAVGAVLLKPLEKAKRDGDEIHAVIKSAAVNHGGYSASFTAPNVSQEAAVIKKALYAGGIPAESISYIEAHGTGTSLGDPIEVQGLKQAFKGVNTDIAQCALGTTKAHIGHAEGAAGIAGLIKVILAMKNKTIPAMPHLEEINPYINMEGSPLYINRQNKKWEANSGFPRRAGISSFGIGGAYAHIVVEEYEQEEIANTAPDEKDSVFVLSARSEEVLRSYSNNIADYVEEQYLGGGISGLYSPSKLSEFILSETGKDIPETSYDEHLLDLGFDIYDYVKIADRLSREMNSNVSARIISLHPTLFKLANFLSGSENVETPRVRVSDLAYTMQVGREAMPYRLAIVTRDHETLIEELRSFSKNTQSGQACFYNLGQKSDQWSELLETQEGEGFLKTLLESGNQTHLAKLWVNGVDVPWGSTTAEKRRLVKLPSYPFQKVRFWYSEEVAVQPKNKEKIINIVDQVRKKETTADILKDIWMTYLSVESINENDNFMALGGTSINSTQVVVEINRRFDTNITVGEFGQCKDLGELSSIVESRKKPERADSSSVSTLVRSITSSNKKQGKLSSDQMRLWVLSQMYPNNHRHNISSAYEITAALNPSILQESMDIVVATHGSIRTRFGTKDGVPYQDIVDTSKIKITFHDNVQSRAQALDIINEAAKRPFELDKAELVRVTVINEGGVVILSIIAHHIIADITSVDVIAKDLITTYSALTNGSKGESIDLGRAQFLDYISLSADSKIKTKSQDISFWREYLKDAPNEITLPFDSPRGESHSHNSKQLHFELGKEHVNLVRNTAKSLSITPFILTYSVFNVVFSELCQQHDFLIGVPNANRHLPDSQDMVGFLANTLVLRSKVTQEQDFESYTKDVKNDLYNVFDHQNMGFGDIAAELKVPSPKNHNPMFQILFNMINRDEYLLQENGISLKTLPIPLVTLDFDILFSVDIMGERLRVSMDFDSDLFETKTVESILNAFELALGYTLDILSRGESLVCSSIGALCKLCDTKENERNEEGKLLISSTFTAEPLSETLNFWLDKVGLNLGLDYAPYNQVFQQLLDPSQGLYSNPKGVNTVLVRLDDWLRFNRQNSSVGSVDEELNRILDDFEKALIQYGSSVSTALVVVLLPTNQENSKEHLLRERVEKVASGFSNINVLGSDEIDAYYSVDEKFDSVADSVGHVPFTSSYFSAIGTALVRSVRSHFLSPYKVIVVDCDNTLWKGVVGELGCEGIQIDPARQKLQEFLVEQKNAGVLLCVASKNVEEDVASVFGQRTDMPLKSDDVVLWKVNWDAKSKNIIEMSNELNLGLDSFVFIDDNPIECAEVSAALPQVLTIQFPQESKEIESMLNSLWDLDRKGVSGEDSKRTDLYQQNIKRDKALKNSSSFQDFIDSLELQIDFQPVDDSTIGRVSQLFLRTNQFNATTRRHSQSQLEQMIRDRGYECTTVSVKDRFGEYGLVGVLLYSFNKDCVVLDSFLLSCRVLGKGVEHRMINEVAKKASQRSVASVQLDFVETEKNIPIKKFYDSIKPSSWDPQEHKYLIKVEDALRFKFNPEFKSQDVNEQPKVIETFNNKSPVEMAEVALNLNSIDKIQAAINKANASATKPAEAKSAELKPAEAKSVASRNVSATSDSDIEEALSNIYKSILRKDVLDKNASFFDLGGTSLQLVDLASKISKEMKKEIPVTVLFQFPSISSLSKHLSHEEPKANRKMSKSRVRALKQRSILKNLKTG